MIVEKRTWYAIVAVVIIIIALIVAAVVINNDDGEDVVSKGINYQGNGGRTADGDTVYGSESYSVLDGKDIFTFEGHVFVGWNTSSDGSGNSYGPGDVFVSDGSARLYAQWAYELDVIWNGGKGIQTDLRYQLTNLEHEQVDIVEGEPVALPDSTWTTVSVIKTGIDWSIDSDGRTLIGTGNGVTYTLAIGHEGATALELSTIVWNGEEYPMIIIMYDGPVTLYISERMN